MTWCCSSAKNHHIILVNKVFPTKPGKEGPSSSDLSYLLHYVKSNPHKLPAVYGYLEKRAGKDLYKQKTGYVKIALDIASAIMNECHSHLKLFSVQLLRLVHLVLTSPDNELMVQATTIFVLFNSYYVHEGILDDDFSKLFSESVKTFSRYTCYDTKVGVTKQKQFFNNFRMHLSGLKAIHAIVSNKTFFLNIKATEYIQDMVPSILSNILNPPDQQEVTDHGNEEVNADYESPSMSKRISIQDELITPAELTNIADNCLIELTKNAKLEHLHAIVNPIYDYVDRIEQWTNSQFVLHCISRIAEAALTGLKYVLIQLTLKRLNETSNLDTKHCLMSVVNQIVKDYPTSVGMAAIDLINSSCDCICLNPQKLKIVSTDAMLHLFHSSMYPDQMNEIIANLIEKIKSKSEKQEQVLLIELAVCVCHAMYQTQRTASKRSSFMPKIFPLTSCFDPSIARQIADKQDSSFMILQYYLLRCAIFSGLKDRQYSVELIELMTPFIEHLLKSTNNQCLYLCCCMCNLILKSNDPWWILSMLGILIKSIKAIPEKSASLQIVSQFILLFMVAAGQQLNVADLVIYSKDVISQRKTNQQWIDVEFDLEKLIDRKDSALNREYQLVYQASVQKAEFLTNFQYSFSDSLNFEVLKQKISSESKNELITLVLEGEGQLKRVKKSTDSLRQLNVSPKMKGGKNLSTEQQTPQRSFEGLRDILKTGNLTEVVFLDKSACSGDSSQTEDKTDVISVLNSINTSAESRFVDFHRERSMSFDKRPESAQYLKVSRRASQDYTSSLRKEVLNNGMYRSNNISTDNIRLDHS